jgi:hypothetical protein
MATARSLIFFNPTDEKEFLEKLRRHPDVSEAYAVSGFGDYRDGALVITNNGYFGVLAAAKGTEYHLRLIDVIKDRGCRNEAVGYLCVEAKGDTQYVGSQLAEQPNITAVFVDRNNPGTIYARLNGIEPEDARQESEKIEGINSVKPIEIQDL